MKPARAPRASSRSPARARARRRRRRRRRRGHRDASPPAAEDRFYLRLGVAHVAAAVVVARAGARRRRRSGEPRGPRTGRSPARARRSARRRFPALIIGYALPWLHGRLSLETVLGLPFKVKFQRDRHAREQVDRADRARHPDRCDGARPRARRGEGRSAGRHARSTRSIRRHACGPYVGAGVAVMFAYDAKVTNPMLTEVSQPDMSIAPAPGLVLQAGLDAKITSGVYARLDVKFIALMLARAEVHHIQVADARAAAVRHRRGRHREDEHVGQPAHHPGGRRHRLLAAAASRVASRRAAPLTGPEVSSAQVDGGRRPTCGARRRSRRCRGPGWGESRPCPGDVVERRVIDQRGYAGARGRLPRARPATLGRTVAANCCAYGRRIPR